jgi:hypothetical protein
MCTNTWCLKMFEQYKEDLHLKHPVVTVINGQLLIDYNM